METDSPPVDPRAVCTLPPRGLAQRIEWVRREILPHAVASRRGADSVTWEFDDGPEIASKLDAWVALERECCSSIDFEHGSDPGRRWLRIRGVDPDAAIFALGAGASPPSIAMRAWRAAGIGAGASLLLCCALPAGIAASFGAGAAAAVAWLDRPWIVAVLAVAVGLAAFRRRPSDAQGAEAGAPSSTKSTR